MTPTILEPQLIDGRPGAHPPVTDLHGHQDAGEVRKVPEARMRAFRLARPVRVLTTTGEQVGGEGDYLLVNDGAMRVVDAEYYQRWYEPAAALDPDGDDTGLVRDRDVIAAIRLALLAAGNDEAAVMAVQLLVGHAAPSDETADPPVRLLVDAVTDVNDLRFALKEN